ncbi:unnamed protein product [Periconia digitata]|uniref:Uncharacterized protein n=1 Tax=Periconia digitata TaxID=1303443 RepID=A0A9W4UKA4_9PLEO|nr:unnamed protein product [Periconia digitata]
MPPLCNNNPPNSLTRPYLRSISTAHSPAASPGPSTQAFDPPCTRGDQSSKNFCSILVAPVMQYPAHKVDIGISDGLRTKHIVSHKAHTPITIIRTPTILDCLWEILHHTSQPREPLGQGSCDRPRAPPNINHLPFASPRISIDQVPHTKSRRL